MPTRGTMKVDPMHEASPEPTSVANRLVLITGLSGSGKSTVANCFEDLGYYCVDNLPLPLLRTLLNDPVAMLPGARQIAVVADVRTTGFADRFPELLRELRQSDARRLTLVFLEASDDALVRRYSESRRPHPLTEDRPLIEDIRRERELLAQLRAEADVVLDTTDLTVHEMRRTIFRDFASAPEDQPEMAVHLVSFGFKHGLPQGADLVFDLRYLPNPHFEPDLRELTGRDVPVQTFLHEQAEFRRLLDHISASLLFLLPRYREENRSYLTVALGCTGGQHRSVAAVEALAPSLAQSGWTVQTVHRELGE